VANTTFNPSDKHARITLSGGNLIATCNTSGTSLVRAVDAQSLGKFYWECTFNTVTNSDTAAGLASSKTPTNFNLSGSGGASVGTTGVSKNTGNISVDGSITVVLDGTGSTTIALGAITSGMVLCVAVDLTSRLIWYRIGAAGNWNANATRNPATGVGGVVILNLGNGIPVFPAANVNALNDQITANFGDTAFVGAVPSGYTSGFTAGASVPTNALASQALAEHWMTTDPDARITQVVAEHWMSVSTTGLQAVVTQVMLEHWMSVAVVVPAAGGPMVTMIG